MLSLSSTRLIRFEVTDVTENGGAASDSKENTLGLSTPFFSVIIDDESFESMLLLEQFHGLKGLGDRRVLDSSSCAISSSICSNFLFFNGAVLGS